MKQFQLAEEELSDSAGLEYGSISIGATETALNIYLLERLKKFHMSYPGVKIKITNHSTPQAIRSLKSGEIDFAVVTTPLEMDGSMNEVELSEFREMLVGGRSFSELENRKLSLKDLKEYPFISLGADTATYHFYDQLFLSYGAELVADTEAATTDQILSLVKNELGLAFLPESMAEEAIRKQEIVPIRLNESIPNRFVSMVYDSGRPMSAAAQKLKKLLVEESVKPQYS